MKPVRIFEGYLGWSNKRSGVEFYRSMHEGRHVGRIPPGHSELPRSDGWGRLLSDDIERDLRYAEGRPVLVIVGERSDEAEAELRALAERLGAEA